MLKLHSKQSTVPRSAFLRAAGRLIAALEHEKEKERKVSGL